MKAPDIVAPSECSNCQGTWLQCVKEFTKYGDGGKIIQGESWLCAHCGTLNDVLS